MKESPPSAPLQRLITRKIVIALAQYRSVHGKSGIFASGRKGVFSLRALFKI